MPTDRYTAAEALQLLEEIQVLLGGCACCTIRAYHLQPRRAKVELETELALRLRARKHRPRGSVMRRKCECKVLRRGCAFCTIRAYHRLHRPTPGQKLFPGSGANFLKVLRQFLQEAQVPGASAFSLKAYRAGHATVMAREGASWAALQSAGEWRGKSPLSYVDATAIDEVAYLENIVADSSEEEAV